MFSVINLYFNFIVIIIAFFIDNFRFQYNYTVQVSFITERVCASELVSFLVGK